ncbi:MAG: hypothetical protein ACOY4D_03380 [Pseudomonadota bacterium]
MTMDSASVRAALATLATALTVAAYAPYLRAILLGSVRPHMFTWIVWGTSTGVAFLAAIEAGGGAGAWVIGFSAIVSLVIAVLAWQRRSDVGITRTDWAFFVAALVAMPLWQWADDPLWAVWLVTVIELLGFGPTLRKTWAQPFSESMSFLAILIVRNALVIAALAHQTTTTVLFPAAAALACFALIAVMMWRRPQVGHQTTSGQ